MNETVVKEKKHIEGLINTQEDKFKKKKLNKQKKASNKMILIFLKTPLHKRTRSIVIRVLLNFLS